MRCTPRVTTWDKMQRPSNFILSAPRFKCFVLLNNLDNIASFYFKKRIDLFISRNRPNTDAITSMSLW
jgi:hypothetical protein